MRLGIRVQLVLALAGLLFLAFVPLFVAVSSLTRTTLQTVRDSGARSLGRAVAAHVSEARTLRGDDKLKSLLSSEIGSAGLAAIGVYSQSGALIESDGEPQVLSSLPPQVPLETERTSTVMTASGRALEVLVPGDKGPVVALLRTDDASVRVQPLTRLMGLYVGIFALALLVFIYIALTQMIVRPVDELSEAAERVSHGARVLEIPRSGARELADLGMSLADMTHRLVDEEKALRAKVLELERATDELRSTQASLIRSARLASVGRLSAGLAHEIGNPISALLGFEDLLLEGGLEPEEQHDFLQRMKRETERIHRVLRDLLDFARPAANPSHQSQPEPPGIVADAVHDACSLVRPQRSYRQVQLTVEQQPQLPLVKLGRSQLVQVLLNLLLNAGDATQGLEPGLVVLRAKLAGGAVRIEVQDNGPGIHPDVAETLFEPFVTTKEVGAGTGLGLAICRGLVESVGGSISAHNSPDGGAVFVVELPAAQGLSEDEPS